MGSSKKIPKQKKLSKKKLTSIKRDVTSAHGNYEPSLTKRALFKTNNVDDSQDLVQTTFLKTLLYLQKGGKIDTMKSFLNHVLNDLIVDGYRKNKTTSLDVLLEKGFEIRFEEEDRIVNMIDGKEIVALIPSLPKKYRAVMHMRYMQSLSLKEISLLTGQTPNTVAVQAHRGLIKLKELYAEVHEPILKSKVSKR